MAKSILTPKQHQFLEYAQEDSEITRWFYLTGGTALSEFYLHHRLSDDIDLFSYSQVNDKYLDGFFKNIKLPMKISEIKKDHIMGLYVYKLIFADNSSLKIDFNEFEFLQIETGNTKFGNLIIDSYFDIAVNKLYTVIGRFQTRDFIDLYFILQKKEFTLQDLIIRTQDKYSATIDTLYLANQFLRSIDLPPAIPKMLIPFDFEEMKKFFIKKAKELGEKSFI